jgi:hypothetical protein
MKDEPDPVPPLDQEMDAALRDAYAFAPAAAEEAAARFLLPAPRAPRWPWILLPAAAAAGIAIGILLRPAPVLPPLDDGMGKAPREVVGFVAMSTGKVTDSKGGARCVGQAIYSDDAIVAASSDGRASLLLSDGTELRLDRGASVDLHRRQVVLQGGRVWSRVAPGTPFLFEAEQARVTVTGTELSVSRGKERTEVQLFSGTAKVEAGGAARELAAGQEVVFAGGSLSEPRRIWSEAVATAWMLDLVAHSGSHDRELAEHIDRLLEDIGHTKAVMIDEEKLVTELGGSCRVPLARYLVSESAQGETEARRKAARVLVRIVDRSVAPELARALRDPDAEVRVSAAEALSRVSGGRVCRDPEVFRAACDDGAAKAADAWVESVAAPKGPPK